MVERRFSALSMCAPQRRVEERSRPLGRKWEEEGQGEIAERERQLKAEGEMQTKCTESY